MLSATGLSAAMFAPDASFLDTAAVHGATPGPDACDDEQSDDRVGTDGEQADGERRSAGTDGKQTDGEQTMSTGRRSKVGGRKKGKTDMVMQMQK